MLVQLHVFTSFIIPAYIVSTIHTAKGECTNLLPIAGQSVRLDLQPFRASIRRMSKESNPSTVLPDHLFKFYLTVSIGIFVCRIY